MVVMKDFFARFLKDDDGTASLEFVLVFPVFFGFFLMTYESGVLSARQVMLEHGVDTTIRKVRVGLLPLPDRDTLRENICDAAAILPDCMEQLEIELIQRDARNWAALDNEIRCIDRGEVDQEDVTVNPTANNLLMFLRACIRVDPFLPSSNLGKAIVANNSDSASGGSYALVTTAAFVVEPFRSIASQNAGAGG